MSRTNRPNRSAQRQAPYKSLATSDYYSERGRRKPHAQGKGDRGLLSDDFWLDIDDLG